MAMTLEFFLFAFFTVICLVHSCSSVTNVSTYNELVDAVACRSEIIRLENNISVTDVISITEVSSMKFIGAGYVLKNSKKTAVFSVATSDLVFEDLGIICYLNLPSGAAAIVADSSSISLTNFSSYSSRGTALRASGSTVTVTYSTFRGISTSDSGGALYLSNSRADVSNSAFIGNQAVTCGGAIVSFQSALNISSCLFDGNSAGDESAVSATKQAGGALYDTDGTVFLSDVIMRNNVGNGNGGSAAFTDSVVIMERSTFESSTANNGGAIAAVGGVHTYTDCVLRGNSAALASSQGSGGALYVSGGAEVQMERASCTSNTASASGGCTAMTGNFSFACLDCTISSNVASNMGGGIYSIRSYKSEGDPLLTILRSNISSNQADSGAGVHCSLTPATFRDCEISHNSAESLGGGIYASGMDSFSIIRTLVNHNSAVKGEGGGIYMSLSSMVISNGTLDHNKASANSGGAVYLGGPSYATIANCSLNNNFASVGSVLAMEDGSTGQLLGVRVEHNAVSDSASISVTSSRLDIWDSSVLENTGGTKGGAILCSQSSVCTIRGTTFIGNTVVTIGGAIFSELQGLVEVWDSIFLDHLANQGGGTFYAATYSSILLHNSLIERSSTFGKGGAAQITAFASMTTYNTTMRDNIASMGGAVHGEFNAKLFFYESVFENNLARYLGGAFSALDTVSILAEDLVMFGNSGLYGGAIYLLIECRLNFKRFRAYNNSADIQGGMMMASGLVETSLEYGVIDSHSATYGAVIDVSAEGVTVDMKHCVLVNNTAKRDAGVIRVTDQAALYMTNCTMSRNSAEFGGAIVVSSAYAYLLTSSIHDNFATDSGGALRAAYSNITMMSCVVEGNRAVENGGALQVESTSTLTLSGCRLTNNSAIEFGGGVFLSDDTNAKFAHTNFSRNQVAGYGGAIYTEKRGVFAFLYCRFEGNYGMAGSVLYATSDSSIYLSSSVMRENTAISPDNGGCIHAINVLSLSVSESQFYNCTGGDGAAIQVDDLGNVKSKIGIINVIDTTFLGNTFGGSGRAASCDGTNNGGAIMLRNLDTKTRIENCSFIENTACYGGGLNSYLSEVVVSNTLFRRNEALVGGGGMFWTITSTDDKYIVMEDSVVNDNNSARYGPLIATNKIRLAVEAHGLESSGSKFESPVRIFIMDYYMQTVVTDSSSVVIVNARDESIISGDTLVMAKNGIVTIGDITMTNQIGGSSRVLFASTDAVTAAIFYFRNCTLGEIKDIGGYYNETVELTKCTRCPYGFYALKLTSKECESCPENANCPGGNTIDVDDGFWRSDNQSSEILRCRGNSEKACAGGSDGSNICQTGSTGPYCAVCEEDRTKNVDGTCDSCEAVKLSRAGIIMLIFIPLGVMVIFLVLYSNREKIANMCGEYYEKVNNKLEEQGSKVKILFAFVQIIAQFPDVLGTPVIPTYTIFSSYLGVLSFNFLSFLKIDCEFDYDFYDRLVFITLLPVVVTPFIYIYFYTKHFIATRQNASNPDFTLWETKRQCNYWFLALSFAVFSPASTVIIQTFVCETFDDGSSYLTADYSLDCKTDRHKFYVTYAAFAALVYPIGTPLYYLYQLRKNIDKVNPPTDRVVKASEQHIVSSKIIELEKLTLRGNDESISHISFLFESYRPGAWYFEVVECMRRLFLSAIPSLILPGTSAQVIIVLLFSLCFSGLYAEFKPFTIPSDSVVAIATEWGVTLTLLLGLMVQVAYMEESVGNGGTKIIGFTMVAVNVGVMLFTIYKFMYNSDDKHSSALDSFKKNRQKKRSSSAANRMKRGSSTVVDVFSRMRQRISRFSVTKRKPSSDPDPPKDNGASVSSPMAPPVSVEMSSTRPPSQSRLTPENVRARIQQISRKDSDDDDSDDDSDFEEEEDVARLSSNTAPPSTAAKPVGGKRVSKRKSKRKSTLIEQKTPSNSTLKSDTDGVIVTERWSEAPLSKVTTTSRNTVEKKRRR